MILLDTNVIIGASNKRPVKVADRFDAERVAGKHLVTSSIVEFELRYGIAKSQRPQANGLVMDQFLKAISILSFEAEDAVTAGTIRAGLERAGTPIGPYGLLIAAQALRHGAMLVTSNVREFERVAGLNVVDWGV